ncbi:YhbY family RNA-binding protein [Castellaniella daejeonensis]|jgi:RNA-binding protein|uniref:YhbY family RNA-binding protein n=1 Tax=Castellaniella daejeonensis TaxID=659013 RepID=A0ABN0TZV3_9BURK|nr:YhbY family RNA-binding protein [Castellaniella sp.]HET8704088.1 YhbY family RNA-binding protein [Castellaniella sp.]
MPKLELTSQQRSALRAAAHPLHPVVLIGDRGLTAAVLEEIDRTLAAHELIKIRVAGAERDERDAMLEEICETLSCAAVHHLGKTLIIYRPDALAQQAAQAAENATRAVRRKSEPYVPKKQAAQPRAARPTARRAEGAGQNDAGKRSAPNAGQKPLAADRRGSGKPAAGGRTGAGTGHGIPRRSGSALSLRAGARRNRTSRG